jgi:hypothetical protein
VSPNGIFPGPLKDPPSANPYPKDWANRTCSHIAASEDDTPMMPKFVRQAQNPQLIERDCFGLPRDRKCGGPTGGRQSCCLNETGAQAAYRKPDITFRAQLANLAERGIKVSFDHEASA